MERLDMTRVLILDGSIHREVYRPDDGWRQWLGAVPSDSVHLPSGSPVPDLAGYSHLVVTGSESSITAPEPWFEQEANAIRRAVELGLRVLGSCFGHQALVRVLSGPEHVARSATPEIGWVAVHWSESDALCAELGNPSWMFASHFDEVPSPPPPWRVLGHSAGCAVQAVRYGARPIWGIQAHPEITPAEARTLMQGFLRIAPEHAALVRAALAQSPRDDGVIAELVRRFLAA
jgi:GMP synthase-like glutamine amidotransferase